jgi:hypothetical protein
MSVRCKRESRSCRLVGKADIKRIVDNNANNLRATANQNPSVKERKRKLHG